MKERLLMIGKFLLVLVILAVASISPSEPDFTSVKNSTLVNATEIEEVGNSIEN